MIRARKKGKRRKRWRRKRAERVEHGPLSVGGQAERSTRSIRLLDCSSMLAVELSTGFVDSSNDQDPGPRNTSKFCQRKDA